MLLFLLCYGGCCYHAGKYLTHHVFGEVNDLGYNRICFQKQGLYFFSVVVFPTQ